MKLIVYCFKDLYAGLEVPSNPGSPLPVVNEASSLGCHTYRLPKSVRNAGEDGLGINTLMSVLVSDIRLIRLSTHLMVSLHTENLLTILKFQELIVDVPLLYSKSREILAAVIQLGGVDLLIR